MIKVTKKSPHTDHKCFAGNRFQKIVFLSHYEYREHASEYQHIKDKIMQPSVAIDSRVAYPNI